MRIRRRRFGLFAAPDVQEAVEADWRNCVAVRRALVDISAHQRHTLIDQEEIRRSSDTVSGPLDRRVALDRHADSLAR
jgi:hypothetical protein